MSSNAPGLFPELVRNPPDSRTTGLLPSQRLEEMIDAGRIRAKAPISSDQIQPSSIDLRLGSIAYRVQASFLPGSNATVQGKLQGLKCDEIDLSKPAVLEKGSVYIVPLQEELSLPEDYSGKANPKSTTGRLDVFTRLITDYGEAFEEISEGYKGKLYAEIVPLTFRVAVREGTRLNQLRIRRGNPPLFDSTLQELHGRDPIVYSQDALPAEPLIARGLNLSVDLQGLGGSDVVGYRAKKNCPPIDLAKVNHYDPQDFWEPLYRSSDRSIALMPGEFYILASKEKVTVPPHMAAEMLPFDPTFGEFRIHYAGFFDPGFGWNAERPTGSHAVLEVRSHEIPSLLEHGQTVCRLNYEHLIAPPARLYGRDIGSSYQSQHLTLSKQFKPWTNLELALNTGSR